MEFVQASTQKTTDLRFYWRQATKRYRLIVAIVGVSLMIGALQVAKTRPLYQATAKLLIEPDQSKVAPFEELIASGQSRAHNETEYHILKSRTLARRVVDTLGLANHPEFAPRALASPVSKQALLGWVDSVIQSVKSTVFKTVPAGADDVSLASANPSDTRLIDNFLSRLKIESARGTHLINVSFVSGSPELAANVANTLARLYMEFKLEMRFAALHDALNWLQDQVSDTRQQVEASEMALQEYKDTHNVHLIDDRLPGLIQEISTLNSSLIQAKTERIELETLDKELKIAAKQGLNLDWVPDVVNNTLIQNLKTRSADLQRSAVLYGQKYGVDHPRAVQVRAELKAINAEVRSEVQQILRAFRTNYKLVQARESAFVDHIDDLKQEVRTLNDKAVQYGVLKREAESNRRVGDMLLDRLKEASVSSDLSSGNIRVIDSAETPTAPTNVRPTRSLSVAGIVGLIAGVGVVAFIGYLDNTLKTPEEAEEYLGLQVAGVIEKYSHKRGTKSSSEEGLVTLEEPNCLASEAFKSLRANLLYSYTDPPRKVYLVTSSHPSDGKTTVASNLAAVMAQAERRVLLVDADLRNASVHKRFNLEVDGGLSDMLLTESYEKIIPVMEDGLEVVTAGTKPPNPSELLGSQRMKRFLLYAREQYDTVIIDTPPVLAVGDAMVLSSLVDCVLLVVKAGSTPYDHARRATNAFLSLHTDQLEQASTNSENRSDNVNLGLIMNFLDPREGTAYGYYGYHNYYYGRSS